MSFDYTYELKNATLTQGNSGRLNYLNNWKLVPKVENISKNWETNMINTVSPAA